MVANWQPPLPVLATLSVSGWLPILEKYKVVEKSPLPAHSLISASKIRLWKGIPSRFDTADETRKRANWLLMVEKSCAVSRVT